MAAKFVVYKDKAGKFRFKLLASNKEIIAVGEAYESKASCLKGIKSIQKNAPIAAIEDETLKKPDDKAPAKKAPAKKPPAKKVPVKKATVEKEKEPEVKAPAEN